MKKEEVHTSYTLKNIQSRGALLYLCTKNKQKVLVKYCVCTGSSHGVWFEAMCMYVNHVYLWRLWFWSGLKGNAIRFPFIFST